MELGLTKLIDPRPLPLVEGSRAFYATRVAGRVPSSWEELRAVRAHLASPPPSQPPAVEELVGAYGRSVLLRMHEPMDATPSGILLEIHGGGFYAGSAAGSGLRNRQLADTLGVVIASVDYRLAPEHPWPAASDDCETAALWLAEHAYDRFGTSRLAIIGFSAGATLATTTLVRLRNQGISAVNAAVLQFGTYDLSAQTPAGRLIRAEYFLEALRGCRPRPHGPGPISDLRRPRRPSASPCGRRRQRHPARRQHRHGGETLSGRRRRRPARLPRIAARRHWPPDFYGARGAR